MSCLINNKKKEDKVAFPAVSMTRRDTYDGLYSPKKLCFIPTRIAELWNKTTFLYPLLIHVSHF